MHSFRQVKASTLPVSRINCTRIARPNQKATEDLASSPLNTQSTAPRIANECNPAAIHNPIAIPVQSVDVTAGEYRTRAGRSAVPFTDCKEISLDRDILTITITKLQLHNNPVTIGLHDGRGI